MNTNEDVKKAHSCSTNNRDSINKSSSCGCFYCTGIFEPSKITDWVEEGCGTALCPECGVDSVIASDSGFPITVEFLSEVREYAFADVNRM